MRDTYIIPFSVVNPTAVPFLQLATPTNAGARILEFYICQELSAVSAQAALNLMRRSTASTLPTTAGTISPLDPTAPATRLTGSTTTNAFGIATVTGTAGVSLQRWGFNVLNGLLWVPTPDTVVDMDVSQFATFQFIATPPADTYSGYVIYREL